MRTNAICSTQYCDPTSVQQELKTTISDKCTFCAILQIYAAYACKFMSTITGSLFSGGKIRSFQHSLCWREGNLSVLMVTWLCFMSLWVTHVFAYTPQKKGLASIPWVVVLPIHLQVHTQGFLFCFFSTHSIAFKNAFDIFPSVCIFVFLNRSFFPTASHFNRSLKLDGAQCSLMAPSWSQTGKPSHAHNAQCKTGLASVPSPALRRAVTELLCPKQPSPAIPLKVTIKRSV